jgi:hypothetical protein
MTNMIGLILFLSSSSPFFFECTKRKALVLVDKLEEWE